MGETLESVIAQTYQNWECIVVDDGSTDRTREVVQSYCDKDSRIKLFCRPNEKPKGANASRNYGYEISEGEWLKWLDSDDILLPVALEAQVLLINDEIDCVIGRVEVVLDDAFGTRWLNPINTGDLITSYLVGDTCFYVSGPLWSRRFLENKDLFDEEVGILMDWDFNLRRLYEFPKFKLHDEVLVEYRRHQESVTRKHSRGDERSIRQEISVRNKHLGFTAVCETSALIPYLKFLSNRFRGVLLATCLARQFTISAVLFRFLIKTQAQGMFISDMVTTTCGFLSFLAIGKGHRFLATKNIKAGIQN